MKKIILAIGLFCLNLNVIQAQFSDTKIDYLSILEDDNDPIQDWPECIEPENLYTEIADEILILRWDQHLDEKVLKNVQYEYQIFQENDSENRVFRKINRLENNELMLPSTEEFVNNQSKIRIRKICSDAKGEILYSEWIESSLKKKDDVCLCRDMNTDAALIYSFINQCFFFYSKPPCDKYAENFQIPIKIVLNSGEIQWFILSKEFVGQTTLIDDSGIASVEAFWNPNSNSDLVCDWNDVLYNPNMLLDDFDLSDCSEEVDCGDVLIEISSASNSSDSTSCLFIWSCDNELQGNIGFVHSGVYNSIDVSGTQGFVSVPNGVSLDFNYQVSYLNGYGETEWISCSTNHTVSCPDNTDVISTDTDWMCQSIYSEWIDINDENGDPLGCGFAWEVPDSLVANVQICMLGGTGECQWLSSNQDTVIVNGGFYAAQISLAYNDPQIGWIFTDCDSNNYECENQNNQDCEVDDLCEVLSLVQGIGLSETTLLLAFQGENDNYLSSALNAKGLSIAEAENLFNCAQSIDLQIDYSNASFPNQQSITIPFYSATNQSNGAASTIDLEAWSYLWESIDTTNLVAFNTFSIKDFNGNEFICSVSDLNIIQEDADEPIDETPIIELPEFECGEEFVLDSITNLDPLEDANIGELFYVGGFPILVCEIVENSPGVFSGSGIVPLPFGSKTAIVDFSHVNVNTDYQIIDGAVFVRPDDPANYPDFLMNPDTLTIGGDICVPSTPPGYDGEGYNEATGLNDYGFDENGIHYLTDSIYDPNGFMADGTYQDTGSPYNDCGCTIDGIDAEGNPCDPACSGHPVVQAFADSVAATVPDEIQTIIDDLIANLQDSLASLDCNAYRDDMDALILDLQFDRTFIFGENDQYFEKGMSQNFAKEPQALAINMSDDIRDSRVTELEDNHVLLYHCDKSELQFEALSDILAGLNNAEAIDSLTSEILARILAWSPYQAELYEDPQKFTEWVLEQVKDILVDHGGDEDLLGMNEEIILPELKIKHQLQQIFDFNQGNTYNSLASVENKIGFSRNELDALSFEFKQGRQKINGYHRAFILEELSRQRAVLNGSGNVASILPLEITNTVGSYTYTIYLDGIALTPGGASLDAYCIITDPGSGKKMVFHAQNVGFGPTGLMGESALSLLTNIQLRLNNASRITLRASDSTYVSWDCNGFTGMGVDMGIEFCRNFIVPLDSMTLQPLPDSILYELDLLLNIPSWLEFTAIVDAPPFAMAGYQQIKWQVENMLLDFSSDVTPQFLPPLGYTSPYYIEGQGFSPMWKGFYMEQLTAQLNSDFSKDNEPVSVSVNDLLIDDSGVTGAVGVSNLIDIDSGNLGGWAFSIDSFSLRVLHNHYAGAGLAGELNVPVFEENMQYEAIMYPDDLYEFTVSPLTDATFDMVLANATIFDDSHVSVFVDGQDVNCLATLNGYLKSDLGQQNSSITGALPEVSFEGFQVSNKSPYFSPGTWGVHGDTLGVSFGGFTASLNKVIPYSPGDDFHGVMFDASVSLSNSVDISADGAIGILGRMETDEYDRQKWVYDHLDPKQFCLEGSFPGVKKIDACLNWYDNNPTYGKGFRGTGQVEFSGLSARVGAIAQFGQVDGYKYFFIDALANVNLGIGVGPLTLDGFGGGISNHMTSSFNPAQIDFSNPGDLTDPPQLIGSTFSGITYTPDESVGLGLKAMGLFRLLSNESLLNGIVNLEFLFNNNNGISNIGMSGFAQMMSNVNLPAPDELSMGNKTQKPQFNAPFTAYCGLDFNFDEPSFHGEMNVFLDAGLISGAGLNDKLVDAVIHFDPYGWKINVGTPSDPAGIELGIPGLSNLLSVTAYFDMGTDIPAAPQLPGKVRKLASKVKTNESFRKSGAGFMFGSKIEVDIEANVANIVSGSLEADAGFDIMVKDYEGYHCAGSSEEIGINGWYASGQMWAYISGQLKVFGFNIIKAGIAAVLQARLPNPTWMQGALAFEVKLLFATFKGDVNFELGEDCILVGNSDSEVGMDIISFINPTEGLENIEQNTRPSINFNIPVGRSTAIPDINGNNIVFDISEPTVVMTAGGLDIPFETELNSSGYQQFIHPFYMLPANDSIHITVSVDVYKNGEFVETQEKTSHFFIDDRLDYIPESNIVATYPAEGMYNVYPKEGGVTGPGLDHIKGFIKLEQSQPSLLYDIPDGVEQVIRLTDEFGESHIIDYIYVPTKRWLTFNIKSDILKNETHYKMELVRITSDPLQNLQNVQEDADDPNVLYKCHFRVSKYGSFEEKIDALDALLKTQMTTDGFRTLKFDTNDAELFDQYETVGTDKYEPLVQFEVSTNDGWYGEFLYPEMYSFLPREVEECDNTEDGLIGLIPCSNGITFLTPDARRYIEDGIDLEGSQIMVSEEHYLGNSYPVQAAAMAQEMEFVYGKVGQNHFRTTDISVKSCVVEFANCCGIELADLENGMTQEQEDCIVEFVGPEAWNLYQNVEFEPIPDGTYEVIVTYRLPGGQVASMSKLYFTLD